MAADCHYLERARPPGIVPTYCFAVLFAVILGTYPVMSYVLTRCLRRWPDVIWCPFCRRPLWDNTIVATNTALLQRCPRCFESLRWRRGFPVEPAPGTRDEVDPKSEP